MATTFQDEFGTVEAATPEEGVQSPTPDQGQPAPGTETAPTEQPAPATEPAPATTPEQPAPAPAEQPAATPEQTPAQPTSPETGAPSAGPTEGVVPPSDVTTTSGSLVQDPKKGILYRCMDVVLGSSSGHPDFFSRARIQSGEQVSCPACGRTTVQPVEN